MPILAKLVAAFTLLAEPSRTLPDPLYPEANTELALLSRLVDDPALDTAFQAFGIVRADTKPLLLAQAGREQRASNQTLRRIRAAALSAASGAHGTLEVRRLPQEDLLAFLVTLGSDEIRKVIGSFGVAPGPLVFWLAHHAHEANLHSTWPEAYPNGARVVLVNDPYSPMEAVHSCLTDAFHIPQDKAAELMLRVHHEGIVHLDLPESVSVVPFCNDCNRQWRLANLPLYVRPVAV